MGTHKQVLKEALRNPKIKEEYNKLDSRFNKIRKTVKSKISKKVERQ